MTKVLVVGDFGKPHPGHLDHILKASMLGDELVICMHPDETIEQKKDYTPDPLYYRYVTISGWVKHLKLNARIIFSDDPLAVEAIRKIRPDIFAKGEDYNAQTLPWEEARACAAVGCQIIFGVGSKLGSSRKRTEATE